MIHLNIGMKFVFSIAILFSSIQVASQNVDTLYYDNGSIKAFGKRTDDGRKVMEWAYFYPSGVRNAQLFYKEGEVLHGSQFYYEEKGNLIAHERWKEGLLQDSSIYFYPEGKVEKKGVFDKGLYEGEWIFYYENGNYKRKGVYKEGVPNGFWKFYLENGRLSQEGELVNGKESGRWKYYDEDGNATYEGEWKAGEKVGQWYFYKRGVKRKWKKFD